MAFAANSLAELFCEYFKSTFTWKTLSVKLLWKLKSLPDIRARTRIITLQKIIYIGYTW